MKDRLFSTTTATILFGPILGWLAANGGLSPEVQADTAPPTAKPRSGITVARSAPGQSACVPQDLLSGLMLAMAEPPTRGATQPAPATSAKKPNIVIIWGDDIGQSDI